MGISRPEESPNGDSIDSWIEGAFIVNARSSITVDCRRSSSSSSAISISLRLRSELVDEEAEPDAVCNEHAADSALSLSSFAVPIEKTVSCGENRSVTALKCTVTRAIDRMRQLPELQRPSIGSSSHTCAPCTSLEQSSGTYLITTFLLLYLRNPNKGEGSS